MAKKKVDEAMFGDAFGDDAQVESFNLDEVEVQDFEAIPPGVYPVHVFDIEPMRGKDSGAPYFNVTLKISEGQYQNRNLWTTISLHKNALWKLKQVCQQFEIDLSGQVTLQDIYEALSTEFRGQMALATVGQRMYEGQLRNEVKKIEPMEDAVPF